MSLSARLAVTLLITWLLLSGLFTVQLLLLGALSIALVVWLWRRAPAFGRLRGGWAGGGEDGMSPVREPAAVHLPVA